jgi:hypothetical protein
VPGLQAVELRCDVKTVCAYNLCVIFYDKLIILRQIIVVYSNKCICQNFKICANLYIFSYILSCLYFMLVCTLIYFLWWLLY